MQLKNLNLVYSSEKPKQATAVKRLLADNNIESRLESGNIEVKFALYPPALLRFPIIKVHILNNINYNTAKKLVYNWQLEQPQSGEKIHAFMQNKNTNLFFATIIISVITLVIINIIT